MGMVILSGKRLQYNEYETTRVWKWGPHEGTDALIPESQALSMLWEVDNDLTTASWRSMGKLGKWKAWHNGTSHF